MYLSKNISVLRKNLGLSQERFAEKIGEGSRGTVAKWETGETKPNIEQIERIADFFNVSIDQLVKYDFSKTETFEAIAAHKNAANLISEMLQGNEKILELVDIEVLVKVIRNLKMSKAESEEGIDKRSAVAWYMEAGALGERKGYEKAYYLVDGLLDEVGDISDERELDNAIELKELSEELYAKAWGIHEDYSDLILLPYNQKQSVIGEFFARRELKEEQKRRAIEEAQNGYLDAKQKYYDLMLAGKVDDAKTMAVLANAYARGAYDEKEVKKYLIEIDED